MRLHIVQVLSSMAVGGQEKLALDLSAGLVRRGHRVSAISLAGTGALSEMFRAQGADVIDLPKEKGRNARLLKTLMSEFRHLSAEVVHTHNPQPLLYAAPAAFLSRVRVIVHTKHGRNRDAWRRVAARRLISHLCDAYVAVSDETAQVARQVDWVGPPRLRIIHNGIDLGRFQPAPEERRQIREELGLPEDAWVVGTVGRLSKEKCQGDLITAAAALVCADGGRPAHLLLVGDGPERRRLEEAAAPLAGRVHFLGVRHDVPRVLQAMDVFCLSSYTEGLPLVLPEAMAMGLPVVATRVGGIPSVVAEGETGLLVEAQAPARLSEALARLRDEPDLARRMGARGRERALARYSLERMIDEYEDLYHSLMQKRQN